MTKLCYSFLFLFILMCRSVLSGQTDQAFFPVGYHDVAKSSYLCEAIQRDSLVSVFSMSNGDIKTGKFGVEEVLELDFEPRQTKVIGQVAVWKMEFIAPNATSISFLFNRMKLSQDAKLFIYDGTQKVRPFGAYTAQNNTPSGLFGTELVYSDTVILEVNVPVSELEEVVLELGSVVKGFRDPYRSSKDRGLNDSGDCNIDVNCPQGAGWEDQRNSVAMILIGGSSCSGSMINNTRQDGTPYLLSANHCYSGNPDQWVFRFRWESPNPVCASTTNSTDGTYYSLNGAQLRARNTNSDMLLLQLYGRPDTAWNVFYAGWDAGDTYTSSGAVGIHHPSGDIKKICFENDTPYKMDVSFGGNPQTKMWFIDEWEDGITEGGSSGSPLYNLEGRVTGMLSGGFAACSGTSGNGEYDYYGRFDIAYDSVTDPNGSLISWLNPAGIDTSYMDGVYLNDTLGELDLAIAEIIDLEGLNCGLEQPIQVILHNRGKNDVLTADIAYAIDGAVTDTVTFSGLIVSQDTSLFTIPNVMFQEAQSEVSVFLINVNSQQDDFRLNDTTSLVASFSENEEKLTFGITLDCFGDYNTVYIVESSSDTLFEGGPYEILETYTVEEEFCASSLCYDLFVYDSRNDGLSGFSSVCPQGDYFIYNELGDTLVRMLEPDGDFGSLSQQNSCTVGVEELGTLEVAVYPNPASQYFTIIGGANEQYEYALVNLTGKVIEKGQFTSQHNIQVKSFPKGLYLLNLSNGNLNTVQKIVVE